MNSPDRDRMRSTDSKLRAGWRVLIAVSALALATAMAVDYFVARSINMAYFGDPTVPFGLLDAVGALIVAYLLLVAAIGRWRLILGGKAP